MEKTYRYRGRHQGVPAEVAGKELDRITAKHGVLIPKDVVDEARPDEAPLHPVFEWNDSVAAEEWRKEQARSLIREIVVIVDEKPPINQFVSIQVAPEGQEEDFRPGYYQTADVMKNPGMLLSAVAYLNSQINAVQRSVRTLTDAAQEEGIEFKPKEAKAVQSIARQIDLAGKNAEALQKSVSRKQRKPEEATA